MNKASKELRGMGTGELKGKLDELDRELIKLNAQVATGTAVKSPGQIRNAKKTIARIKQFLAEKEKTAKQEKPVQAEKKTASKSAIGGK